MLKKKKDSPQRRKVVKLYELVYFDMGHHFHIQGTFDQGILKVKSMILQQVYHFRG